MLYNAFSKGTQLVFFLMENRISMLVRIWHIDLIYNVKFPFMNCALGWQIMELVFCVCVDTGDNIYKDFMSWIIYWNK